MISTRLRGVAVALTLAASGCGPSAPPVKHPVKKQPVASGDTLLQQARAAAQKGDANTADQKYQEAEKAKPDVAIVQEHVDWLIKVKRVDAAVATAKAYYEA